MSSKFEFMVSGDKILGRKDDSGFYFPAIFLKLLDSKNVKIKFDDGPKIISVKNTIIPIEFYHFIVPGNHVMAKVIKEVNNIPILCWVPGVVQAIRTNVPACTHTKKFIILYFNGQLGDNSRTELIQISSQHYGYIVSYILSVLGDKVASVPFKAYPVPVKGNIIQPLPNQLPNPDPNPSIPIELINIISLKIYNKCDKIFELSDIKKGEEVLARWPDDGWYYRSIVREYLGNNQYLVDDSLKDCETFNREDLISDMNKPLKKFEIGDCVVALHPIFEFSYAPGEITQISNDKKSYDVKFYNSSNGIVKCDGIFKISKLKYETDVERILQLENNWIGKEVIARNNLRRTYELGDVICKESSSLQYKIKWKDGSQTAQEFNHIFGKNTRKAPLYRNEYVLAPKEEIYLPGKIIKIEGNKLTIRFCDASEDENVAGDACFLLSKDYYEDAKLFCRRRSGSCFDKKTKNNDYFKQINKRFSMYSVPMYSAVRKKKSKIDISNFDPGKLYGLKC